ncbi:hypothetical protein VU607_05580 [Enterobacter cloacae]|uniref:hypothetical protein n=1 Tax=Enterobacter cloacae TaxID=550 RepID=UPI003CF64092
MSYTKQLTLESGEYISDYIKDFDFNGGIIGLNSSVGTGKTTGFINMPNVDITVPFIAIKQSEIDKGAGNIDTWQARVIKVKSTFDKSYFSTRTLVVDEAHGLYMDYNYKAPAIRDLISIFKYYHSVILMSGTFEPEYISSINLDRFYNVYKPQLAMKVLDTYIYDRNGLAAFEEFIHARKDNGRKKLVLINDKAVCNQLSERYGDDALVVNADEKANDDVLELYRTRKMGNQWSVIFGTNSIREGLSIEDVQDEVDVFIYGHTDPDVIEQFSNRFRNVGYVKHVHYFIPNTEVRELADFDINGYTASAQRFADVINTFYKSEDNTEQYKEYLRSAYHEEVKGSHLKYDKESDSFIVNLISIDAEYYSHREKQAVLDPVLFAERMMSYDFNVNPRMLVSGDSGVAEVLKEGKRAMKEQQQDERNKRIASITESFRTGKFEYAGDEEYDYVVESINTLLKKGLKREQIELVVNGIVEDKEFIRKRVWPDFNYVDHHTNIRNQMLRYIATDCPDDSLNVLDMAILSGIAIKTTLTEFFQGDETEMRKNKEWRKVLEWRGGQLVAKDGCEARIINRYITLGKRKEQRISKDTNAVFKAYLDWKGTDRYQVYPVKYTNLTGFEIEQPAPSESFNASTDKTANAIRERLLSLRMAA